MTRREFDKPTKRAALSRSEGYCEAEGSLYDREGRCNADLGKGFEFDHVLACSNGGENSLDNCLVVCPACHSFKTRTHDTPRAAKIKRTSDKYLGIVKPKGTIKSRRFNQSRKPNDKQTSVRF